MQAVGTGSTCRLLVCLYDPSDFVEDNRLMSLGGCCCRVHNTIIGGPCVAAGNMDSLITGDEACCYDEIVTTVETDDELEQCDWPDYENTVVVGGHKRG